MSDMKQKYQLLKGLLTGEQAFSGPMYVCVDITRRCNLRCTGCFSHGLGEKKYVPGDHAVLDVPFPLVERVMAELRMLGTRKVSLSGEGEPLLHPRIFDIIASCKREGMQVQLFTNGTLLREETILSLLRSGVDIVKVSLWGSTPEEYAKCHKGADISTFGEILASLSTLSRLKMKLGTNKPVVFLNHILTGSTYGSIDGKVDLALEAGCNGVLFHPFISSSSEASSEELTPRQISELCENLIHVKNRMASLSLVNNINETLLQYRLGKSACKTVPCYTGWYQARVRVDGAVMPCVR